MWNLWWTEWQEWHLNRLFSDCVFPLSVPFHPYIITIHSAIHYPTYIIYATDSVLIKTPLWFFLTVVIIWKKILVARNTLTIYLYNFYLILFSCKVRVMRHRSRVYFVSIGEFPQLRYLSLEKRVIWTSILLYWFLGNVTLLYRLAVAKNALM